MSQKVTFLSVFTYVFSTEYIINYIPHRGPHKRLEGPAYAY